MLNKEPVKKVKSFSLHKRTDTSDCNSLRGSCGEVLVKDLRTHFRGGRVDPTLLPVLKAAQSGELIQTVEQLRHWQAVAPSWSDTWS